MKHFLAALVALFLTASPVVASGEDQAKTYVQNLAQQVISTVQSKSLSQKQKNAKLEGLFNTQVDIDWIGKFVTGRFWKQATESQKSRYLKEYRRFVVSHYTARFNEYTGGGFTVTDAREDGEGEYTVSMMIGAKDKPILVDYRLRRFSGGFRIFDLNIEGVSMITTQRSEFTSVISSKGLDYLAEELSRKTTAIVKTGKADAS